MISIFSFTKNGAALGEKIHTELLRLQKPTETIAKYPLFGGAALNEPIGSLVSRLFCSREALIFVGAAGIAVRAIASSVAAKDRDPAVLVVDDTGRFIVPILSGHIGGANKLALLLAQALSAEPVLTTATDQNKCFAVDSWAREQGLFIENPERIKDVSAALLRGDTVSLHCAFPLEASLPDGLRLSDEGPVGIQITAESTDPVYPAVLFLRPKPYIMGIGCRKGIAPALLSSRLSEWLFDKGIAPEEIAKLVSVDLKREEEAILLLAGEWRIPFETYSSEELAAVLGRFIPSRFVQTVTGVDNVCERAAVAAVRRETGEAGEAGQVPPELILPKQSGDGVTAALAQRKWRCRF